MNKEDQEKAIALFEFQDLNKNAKLCAENENQIKRTEEIEAGILEELKKLYVS